jgi:hypothetical protein
VPYIYLYLWVSGGREKSHSEVKGVVAASMLGNQVGARALEPVKRAPHLSLISDLGSADTDCAILGKEHNAQGYRLSQQCRASSIIKGACHYAHSPCISTG